MADWTGFLRLEAGHKLGKTIPAHVYFQGALKVTRPIYLDESGQASFYLMNPGGGYVDGDRYRMEFVVAEDARVLLTTQSSTKIYKTKSAPVLQETEIVVKKGGFLEYIPDPIIAYQDARYRQNTVIRMERGAVLVASDIITPGWSPDGELYRYRMLQLKTEVYLDEQLVAFDHLRLQPDMQNMHALGILEGYTHYGSMLIIGDQASAEFLEELHTVIEGSGVAGKVGCSALTIPGIAVRMLASSTQEIEQLFEQCTRFVRKQWFDLEPVSLRKY
ncbi:urease accessory protein UreD [Brevibacillus reuszeri]|uniref:urease accessory protein UreD n=1 Tax=Brevibacillus reuszeri TaxID=54915 RepID=UPI002898FC09|nr:urease accessory protein UreD [Brevibacillus reuszeri]